MRERMARQIQRVNDSFWGTLHANTMHKRTYNDLLRSKEAASFGTLGPSNSLTKGQFTTQVTSALNQRSAAEDQKKRA